MPDEVSRLLTRADEDATKIAGLEEQVRELRQSLIGGIEGVKAGRDLTKWAEANERLLARK
jgi:hypothetical protein